METHIALIGCLYFASHLMSAIRIEQIANFIQACSIENFTQSCNQSLHGVCLGIPEDSLSMIAASTPDLAMSNSLPVMLNGLEGSTSLPNAVPFKGAGHSICSFHQLFHDLGGVQYAH